MIGSWMRPLALASLTAAAACAAPAIQRAQTERPNIIFIVADDLGYGDVAVNGGAVIRTPNIDGLAASGVNFTNGHVTASLCAPSRMAIFTARHQQRLGYEFNPVERDLEGVGLSADVPTLPGVLRERGYRTALVGKWHLGRTRETHPLARGFDEFFGFTGGGTGYLASPREGDLWIENPVPGSVPGFRAMSLERGYEPTPAPEGYMTDLLTDEAVAFIDRNAASPFFITVAYHAPHTPLQATAEYLQRYQHIEDVPTRIYAAMVSAMDDGVGRIVEALERHGLRENTLIVFMSDNGCAHYIGLGRCSNRPFQGFKGTYYEGGIRVPMIASWPARLPRGSTDDRMVMSFDWSVTAMAAGGAATRDRGFDGVDLMPFLGGGDARAPHDRLHWRTWPNYAITDGDWKLWMVERADGSGMEPMLFNLSADPGETTNLASQHPEIVARLCAAFDEWNANLPLPAFESQRGGQFTLPGGIRANIYG